MPMNKDLKRLARSRMQKTGESYATARAQLLRKKDRPDPTVVPESEFAGLAGMGDAAVRAKTGRTWKQWVRVLDAVDAAKMPHRDIALHLHEKHGVPGWWAQMVTVGYERIRGLRDVGQRRGGGYDVNKSKTLPVPLAQLYRAFSVKAKRVRWLPEELTIRTSTKDKSMRMKWADGSPVEVYFTAKGASKSQVSIQHRELAGKQAASKCREEWGKRLLALAELLRASRR